ncbi:MAG: hypothetical protein RMK64_12285, partial [Rhodovarius sp.]|nr:hypothetical protein [Rhodovarius sp.]
MIEFYDRSNATAANMIRQINVGTATPASSFTQGGFNYYVFSISTTVRNNLIDGTNPQDDRQAIVYEQGGVAQQVLVFGNNPGNFTFTGGPNASLAGQQFSSLNPSIVMGGGFQPMGLTFIITPGTNAVQVNGPTDPNQPCFLSG